MTFKSNLPTIRKIFDRVVRQTLDDWCNEVCQEAERAAPMGTGTLRQGISTRFNMGRVTPLTTVRAWPERGRWIERREPTGRLVRVPINEVHRVGTGWEMEFGSYAPHSASIEEGALIPAIEPRPDRARADGAPRTNPHLRFDSTSRPGGRGFTRPSFAKRARAHYIPPKPFLRPAVLNSIPRFPHMLQQRFFDEVKKGHLLNQDRHSED